MSEFAVTSTTSLSVSLDWRVFSSCFWWKERLELLFLSFPLLSTSYHLQEVDFINNARTLARNDVAKNDPVWWNDNFKKYAVCFKKSRHACSWNKSRKPKNCHFCPFSSDNWELNLFSSGAWSGCLLAGISRLLKMRLGRDQKGLMRTEGQKLYIRETNF